MFFSGITRRVRISTKSIISHKFDIETRVLGCKWKGACSILGSSQLDTDSFYMHLDNNLSDFHCSYQSNFTSRVCSWIVLLEDTWGYQHAGLEGITLARRTPNPVRDMLYLSPSGVDPQVLTQKMSWAHIAVHGADSVAAHEFFRWRKKRNLSKRTRKKSALIPPRRDSPRAE